MLVLCDVWLGRAMLKVQALVPRLGRAAAEAQAPTPTEARVGVPLEQVWLCRCVDRMYGTTCWAQGHLAM